MADEVTKTKYTFTPAEAAFFARQAQEAANMQTALQAAQRSALLMVLTQQGLQGNWRLAEDGSGLIREDAPAPAQIAEPAKQQAAAGAN
jgi:hypothetical protein